VELQDGLNRVWKVKTPLANGLRGFIRQRLATLALVSGIAFLLLVSLAVSATLSAIGALLSRQGGELIFSWMVVTALFAAIFKILPNVSIEWSDVWTGAAVTGALFNIGKFLVGLYLGKGALTSTYGAAGSFVAILIWVYYSVLILYFGAEFTKAYADRYGSHKKKSSY
jgi:membrane protein